MLNQESVSTVENSKFYEWRKPCYDSYCFSKIPATISHLLLGDKNQEQVLPKNCFPELNTNNQFVVLIFMDAFGWSFFSKAREMNLSGINRFLEEGTVSLLTSMFPSTTAAHVHTLNTGLPFNQTGIIEWRMYEKSLDRVISPLLFSRVEDAGVANKEKIRESLFALNIAQPEDIFTPSELFGYLLSNEIDVYEFYPEQFVDSCYNRVVGKESQRIGYSSLETGLLELYQTLSNASKTSKKGFLKFYSDLFDSVSHKYGPYSQEIVEALNYFFPLLEKEFLAPLSQNKGIDVTVLITADHGHIGINPEDTIYLDEEIPELISFFKQSKSGAPIFPCGSRRDLFLHVKPEYQAKVYSLLSDRLSGIARVFYTKDVLHLFGSEQPSTKFLDNLGDILVLPLENKGVFLAGEAGMYKKDNIGEHGGLSAEEMEITFGALKFS